MSHISPNKVLMCKPEYFDVTYAGNKFMIKNQHKVKKDTSLKQWEILKDTYNGLGYEVNLIEPVEDLVDMVFTANQSLPFIDTNGNKKVILSKMRNQERRPEVAFFEEFYENEGYGVISLPDEVEYFEGMGDAILDYEKQIIFGGIGIRTQRQVYKYLSEYTNFHVATLNLTDVSLYHLDTCFSILNPNTVVIDRKGFDIESLKKLTRYFDNIIEADHGENMKYFVCNCHCPDGKNVIVQKGSKDFKNKIKTAGFDTIEVNTSEFIKSGGSVFCMKLMYY
ncbi:MAG: amidinotransferase [Ignavibacteriae bacterium]|nr:amidinotransferase [Ignavibacteriota bacterium]